MPKSLIAMTRKKRHPTPTERALKKLATLLEECAMAVAADSTKEAAAREVVAKACAEAFPLVGP